ncbi:hypothetical protein AZF37_03050 [endosymbiont 'TC1' of Trimyema compressum]|uniref:sporulation integral membrane protein YtvI n=1 Tax=endosymbiont 'TC1' of Trimyema compressum TaxID=243899 RepID=UPI0007F17B3A|nr:sporulation integral membrane protein YtvI [endosymbiont 'TC1' of Trimyema compressum]AMP20283.1 hypothetical protein AZF37_03050 [endosymbiont 'TC1' of Trimyema compressum]
MDTIEKRRRFIINSLYFFIIAVIIYLIFIYAIGWVMPFIIGFIIAYMINPIVNFITSKVRFKRGIVSTIFIILTYLLLILIFVLIIVELIVVIQNLLNGLPSFYEAQIKPFLVFVNSLINDAFAKLSPVWQTNIVNMQAGIMTNLKNFLISASEQGLIGLTSFTANVPGFFFAMIFTVMASLFMSADYPNVKKFILTQLPDKARILVRDTKVIFFDTTMNYIKAHVKLMLIVFVMLAIGLLILQQQNAIALAFGISIFDLIPVFGTGIIIIPWIIIALIQGHYGFAIGLIIVNVVVTIVRSIIEPKLVGKQLGLSPLVTLIAIYLGSIWRGIPGMILMPIAAQIILTLQYSGKIKIFKNNVSNASEEIENDLTQMDSEK